MHATSAVGIGAALFKYVLPASATSCRVTDQIMIMFTLFYDVSFEDIPVLTAGFPWTMLSCVQRVLVQCDA